MTGEPMEKLRAAVDAAEEETGLQLCVYLGPAGDEEPRALAARLFDTAAERGHPAALLLVAPDAKRVEILTAPWAQERLPDAACEAAIEVMRPTLRKGKLEDALVAGLRHLATVAGPGAADEGTGELPDVIDERHDDTP